MKKNALLALGLALCLAFSASMSSGCFGSFAATGKLYKWNKSLGSKWVKTAVFWGLCIIPAYELFAFGDVVVLNVIEFWTGSNPLAENAGPPKTEMLADGSVRIEHGSQVYRILPEGERSFVLLANGEQLGRGELNADGDLLFDDQKGKRSLVLTSSELAQLRPHLASAE